jgi:hypothetical protein|tara:strand:+ start:593 stop:802 length:210 start_codon:yes stop_codon:yes gene_type:complete
MQINQLPFYDGSVNETGCCPRFDSTGWDGQDLAAARGTIDAPVYLFYPTGQKCAKVCGKNPVVGFVKLT